MSESSAEELISYESLLEATRDSVCLLAETCDVPGPVFLQHGLDPAAVARAGTFAGELHLGRLDPHWSTLPIASHARRLFATALVAGARLGEAGGSRSTMTPDRRVLALIGVVDHHLDARLEEDALPALDHGLGGAHCLLGQPLREYVTRMIDLGLAVGLG